jgi:hypothetical protein
MLSIQQANLLGNILNSDFGKASSGDGTYGIKSQLAGNRLIVNYNTMAYLPSEHSIQQQVPMLADQANQRVDRLIAEIKQTYKDKSGQGIKLANPGMSDSLEFVQASYNSPRKVVLYKRKFVYDLG